MTACQFFLKLGPLSSISLFYFFVDKKCCVHVSDPGFWSDELYEDERAIDSIFEEEEMKIQLAEIKNQLSATFPHFDKELLNLIAEEFLFDPDGLSVFIQEEEERKLKIDQQFALMMEELPDLDPFVLRRKAEEVEG